MERQRPSSGARAEIGIAPLSNVATFLTSDQRTSRHSVVYAESVRPGLQHLSRAWLAENFDVAPERIDRLVQDHRVALRRDNRLLAWTPEPGGDGVLYYLPSVESAFASSALVEVQLARRSRVFGRRHAGAKDGASASRQTIRAEEDLAILLAVGDDANDFWYWKQIGGPSPASVAFALPPMEVSGGGSATLMVEQRALVFDRQAQATFEVSVNGSYAGSLAWRSQGGLTQTLEFPAHLLIQGVNTVELTSIAPSGGTAAIGFVESLTLTAQTNHQVSAEEFRFQGIGGDVAVAFPQTTNARNVAVLDLSDRLRPRRIVDASVTQVGSGLQASFASQSNRPYVALELSAAAAVAPQVRIEPRYRGRLNRLPPVEHVVLTPKLFVDAANRLSDHRNAAGTPSRVVEIEWVWQDFGGGQASPAALARFAEMIAVRWETKSLVLLGSGHLDYKHRLFDQPNWIPAAVRAREGVAGSDQVLATAAPGLVIGRIHVDDAAVAGLSVDALLDAEKAAQPVRDWLVLTDNTDPGGNFLRLGSAIDANLDLAGSGAQASLSTSSLVDLRGFVSDWRTGGDALFFLGHGGFDRMAAEGIVTTADKESFSASGDVTSLGAALSCLIGRFELPFGQGPLASEMVNSGAFVSFWAPSWTSLTVESTTLGSLYADALSSATFDSVGALIEQVRADAIELGLSIHTLDRMVLFGDPASPLRY